MLNSDLARRPDNRQTAVKPNPHYAPKGKFRSPYAPGGQFVADQQDQPAVADKPVEQQGFQKLAFRAGLAMLFVRMTALPELLVSLIHVNTYLLYVVGPPAILGAMVTGGLARTFKHRAAWCWLGFVVFMLFSVPTSTWVGGSAGAFRAYLQFVFPMLFVMGGLTANWTDVRRTFYTMGIAGVFLIAAASVMAKADAEGRTSMIDSSTTIGNSNDLASLLILVIPFILFIAADKKRATIIRVALLAPVAYAFKMILGTGSRGALVALAIAFLFVLFRASAKQKVGMAVAVAVMAVAAPFVVNSNALERLASLTGGEVEAGSVGQEAMESQAERRYVLEQSLIASLYHPVFGVGLGQFSNYIGELGKSQGKAGAALHWTETHNSFTQVSSECGMPALILFIAAIVTSFASVSKMYRRARREGYEDVANVCFFYLVAMLPYVISIIFLANAYRLYLPTMIGLAIAITATADREMSRRGSTKIAPSPWAVPFRPAVRPA